MRFIMVEDDVAWFYGERETWHMIEHLVAWFISFGGPTIFILVQNISTGGPASPFRAQHHLKKGIFFL
jgi:hypothetical protein